MLNQYEKLMKRCINLAKKGEGKVAPNPLVGSIIFDDKFNIISEGWHKGFGQNHAERDAILKTNLDLKDKSIIVNLEPCSHYGKTPPCADLIIEKGIKRVIIGMIDPNPIVSGQGIKKLKSAKIEVITGILESQCRELNKIFIKNQLQNKPYITIKTAITLDGKISAKTGSSKWITDEYSRYLVHKMRNKYDAVLTSSRTIIADNPSYTCRIKNGRTPVRIVIDSELTSPSNSQIYNDNAGLVYIVTKKGLTKKQKEQYPNNIKIIECPEKNNHVDIEKAMDIIYEKGITSILIEAGGILNKTFIENRIVDDIYIYTAPKILGDEKGYGFVYGFDRKEISECNNLSIKSVKKLKNDILIYGKFV